MRFGQSASQRIRLLSRSFTLDNFRYFFPIVFISMIVMRLLVKSEVKAMHETDDCQAVDANKVVCDSEKDLIHGSAVLAIFLPLFTVSGWGLLGAIRSNAPQCFAKLQGYQAGDTGDGQVAYTHADNVYGRVVKQLEGNRIYQAFKLTALWFVLFSMGGSIAFTAAVPLCTDVTDETRSSPTEEPAADIIYYPRCYARANDAFVGTVGALSSLVLLVSLTRAAYLACQRGASSQATTLLGNAEFDDQDQPADERRILGARFCC